MTLQDKIKDWIVRWEQGAGESFSDYFMHDNIGGLVWSGFLLGVGHIEHANKLLKCYNVDSEHYFDIDELFEVYPEYDEATDKFLEYNRIKNIQLWSEYLSKSEVHYNRFLEFAEKDYQQNLDDAEYKRFIQSETK